MRIPAFTVIFIFLPLILSGQKGLKSITDFANNSADEVSAVVSSVISYYPRIPDKIASMPVQYVCPVQMENFYYEKALKEGATMGNVPLVNAMKELRVAAEKVESASRVLETYHRLEDYKQDNFTGARKLVEQVITAVREYRERDRALFQELERAQQKMPAHGYTAASDMMRAQLRRERNFLDLFRFNLKEETHTGWLTQQIEKSILETDDAIKQMVKFKPQMNYPASSMWPSFIEGLKSVLEVKRNGFDQYNFEARKSDKHSNDVYLSLINYYNGVLVADYNTFLGFSANEKFNAVPALKYIPAPEIRTEKKVEEIRISPYEDVAFALPPLSAQRAPIQRPVYKVLTNYVEFINETYRQVQHYSDLIRNLNSSAAYYATLTDYSKRGKLYFVHEGFELPLSQYQKTLTESKLLPKDQADALNRQCKVLLDMLKELDQTGAALEQHAADKKYEADHCAYIYQLLERSKVVVDAWDERKEELFNGVRKIFDSYPVQDAANSWQRSGADLWKLTLLDRDGVFLARKFYLTGAAVAINAEAIDQQLRAVISKEFENMKGIEKLGRNNGRCPYTPYEDLPKNSRTLNDYLRELKPAKPDQTRYQHPYHSIVYVYNEVVDDYNTFSSLSPVPHLPAVLQPELFVVQYPKKQDTSGTNTQPVRTEPVVVSTPVNVPNEKKPEIPGAAPSQKVVHDTVYIHSRDTVFLREPGEQLRSMEGYAINNMVLLLDVSGSMNAKDKLPLLKDAVLHMLEMMRPEDKLSILVFSGKPKVLLQNASFRDEAKIRTAIAGLKPSGKTDGNAGIRLACKVADQNYIRGGNNRIIMATDGEFVVDEASRKLVQDFAGQDIFFSVFNFSKNPGKVLQDLTVSGKGNYELINSQNVEFKLIGEAKAKRGK